MADSKSTSTSEGLTRSEVAQRVEAGQVNQVPNKPNRTTREIIRANVVTRFNFLLGALLLIVLIVLREPRDALFGFVLVTNSAIGIIQELRAKRTLDHLELLATPTVRLIRSGEVKEHQLDQIVVDDLIDLRPGDQLAVDGVAVRSAGLEIDESLISGESEPVVKEAGDDCLSGSFVAAGTGQYRATRVGVDSYAARLAEAARQFTLVRSELRDGIDRILALVSWVVVPMGALLVWSSLRGGLTFLEGLGGAVASGVAMVPQGLVLLASIAFAVGVIRLGRRNVLVQELPAIEGLARVDTVCFDKTGTLTEGKLTVKEVIPLSDLDFSPPLAALAAAEPYPNATLAAISDAFPDVSPWRALDTVPFSSERKWSGASFAEGGTWVIGAPDILARQDQRVHDAALEMSSLGSRVLLLATTQTPITAGHPPAGLEPVALLGLTDQVRADAADTLRYFADQGVEVKVISGDHPETVGAIAALVGLGDTLGVVDARDLPEDSRELAAEVEENTVFGRVTPGQKRAMVRALQSRGHVVAMTGDGVNDVLALKDSDVGLALGDGAPASRAVAQFVLIDGRFDTLPEIVGEGRRVASNVERVANLFLTSTVYALGLSLAIVISTLPFPFLPRHLTLVGSLTVGIPAFFLALAPSHRRARSGFVGRVLKFAIPTGTAATLATFAGFYLAYVEGSTLVESRTTATLILAVIGLFVLGIISRPLVPWKTALIAAMGALLLLAMVNSSLREFLAMDPPRAVVLVSAVGIAAITGMIMIFALRAVGWVNTFPEIIHRGSSQRANDSRRLADRVVEISGWERSFPTDSDQVAEAEPTTAESD